MKKLFYLITVLCFSAVTLSAREGMPKVVLPELPVSMDFAGEAVPLGNFDTRESLQRELMVTCYMHSRTMTTLLNMKRYISVIEPILKKNDIPRDFIYLCMAESGFNPNAVSSAGAGGLWQFMKTTGKSYGLEVDQYVDERFHLEKSTQAACEYIRNAYERFGSWTLAAAAYNLGNNGVATRLQKQGVDDYYDSFFPEETLRYVFRILSFKLVVENPDMYGFEIRRGDYHKPYTDYKEISVSHQNINWPQVAGENGTNYKMLRELNNWIRDYTNPNRGGKTYKVKVPGKNFRD